jgi:chromosome segregation ATPase
MDHGTERLDGAHALAAAVSSPQGSRASSTDDCSPAARAMDEAIGQLRAASARIKRSEAQAEDLERKLRAAEGKAAQDRSAAERKLAVAEQRARDAEANADHLEARAEAATGQVHLLSAVIKEELGDALGATRKLPSYSPVSDGPLSPPRLHNAGELRRAWAG